MNSVCKYYLNGFCDHGKSCSFLHQKPVLGQKPSKKVVCRYFPQGKCAYGDKCPRAHIAPVKGHSTKAASDGDSDGGNQSQSAGSNHSQRLGAFDSQSDRSDASSNHEREDGDHHSPHEETQPEPSSSPPPQDTGNLSDDQEKSQSQCIFYSQGLCQAGDGCNFLHTSPGSTQGAAVNEQAKAQNKRIICKHFQRGHCRLEDKSKHEHEVLPNRGQMATDQSFGSDSPPASETRSPVFDDSQLDANHAQMSSTPTTDYTNSPQEKWEDDRPGDENNQPDHWGHEPDAEVLDDQPPIQSSQGVPFDTNNPNMNEDQPGQWESRSSNTGQSSPRISQGFLGRTERTSEETQPSNSENTRKRKGPSSYYGEGRSEVEIGSPKWPVPSPTNRFLDEPAQPIPALNVYPHVSEVKPHWTQFADPLAKPTIAFCKTHAQGQCTQGDSCRFRHSLTPQEYTLLFLDQQPNLWTLQRTSSNDVDQALERNTQQYAAPTQSIQRPEIISQNATLPHTSSRPECAFFSRGKCHNGRNCPFQHTNPPPEVSATRPEQEWGTQERTYTQKGKPCKYYASGRCNNGKDCKFLHDGDYNNGREPSGPNSSSEPADGQPEDDNGWGNSVVENHGNDADWEVQAVDDSGWGVPVDLSGWGVGNENENATTTTTAPKPKKQICYQFANHGICRFNADCKYSHDTEPRPSTSEEKKDDSGWSNNRGDYSPPGARPESPILPCPYFLKGHCKEEETCNYSHDLNARHQDEDQQPAHATDSRDNDEPSHMPDQSNDPVEEDESWKQPWPVEEHSIQPNDGKINAPCKRYGQGYCKYAENCRYMHIDNTRRDSAEPETTVNEGSSLPANGPAEPTDDISTEMPTALNEGVIEAGEVNKEELSEAGQELEPITFDHPMVRRLLMNCEVTFGQDSTPDQITTASDCNKIILTELPHDVDLEDIRVLCRKYGHVNNVTNIDMTQDFAIIQVEFAETSETINAVKHLNGHIYHGRTITATLKALTMKNTDDMLVLKVAWPSPSVLAWSHYPTITQAKKEAARLNDIIYRGRNIKATFVTPLRSQKDSFAIKIDRLPADVTKSDLEELCTDNTLITMNQPSYTVDASDAILSALDASRGLDTFDPLTGNNERAMSIAFAVFKSKSMAKATMERLDSKPQEYLGKQAMTLRPAYYSRYRILRDQLDALQNELDRLVIKSDKRCTIQIDEHHDTSLVWIRMYAPLEVGPTFHAELKELLSGTVLKAEDGSDLWDDYFDLPSSAKPLKQLSNAYIYRDLRTKQLKVYGSSNEREEVQKSIAKLLSKVRSQRHELELPRSKLHPLINGGLAILKTDVGLNKVSLDVFNSRLIVRGTTSDVSKATSILDSLHPRPSPFTDFESCQICLHTPVEAVTLSCHHRYCASCLQFAIQQAEHAPVRCISQRTSSDGHSKQCSAHVPYVVIRDILPTNEEREFLLSSFLHHVRSSPDEFFCCPALNCQATYRRLGEKGVNLKCKFCLSDVCTFCKSLAHVGVSCEETVAN